VAGNMMARNPQLGAEYKFVLKDSPNFIGVAKGEDKLRLKVNEIIAAAKARRRPRQDGQSGWAARRATCRTEFAAPEALLNCPMTSRCAAMATVRRPRLRLSAVLAEWPLLLRGVAFTSG
jgi:hypothetical protein